MNYCIRQIFDMLRAMSGCIHPGSKEGVGQSLDRYLPQGMIKSVTGQSGEFMH